MVKPAPAASFKVSQAEFLLQFLIVALDDPTLLGQSDQIAQAAVRVQIRHPVFARFSLALGPLYQQPFFRMRLGPFLGSGANRGVRSGTLVFRRVEGQG